MVENPIRNARLVLLPHLSDHSFPGGRFFADPETQQLLVETAIDADIVHAQSLVQIRRRLAMTHPHLCLCGLGDAEGSQSVQLKQYFEYHHISLAAMVEQRVEQQLWFCEEDLLAVAQGILSCLSGLQQLGIAHGRITSSSIYFDVGNRVFKIYDNELLFGRLESLRRPASQFFNLSPELIQASRQGLEPETSSLLHAADVFALGMTLLEAASLSGSWRCYGREKTLIEPVLAQRLEQTEKVFSAEFAELLHAMLEFDPRKRRTFNEILKMKCFRNQCSDAHIQIEFSPQKVRQSLGFVTTHLPVQQPKRSLPSAFAT